MDRVEPRTLPGFMELLPQEQIIFNQIKEKIQKSYEKFGFLPLDTPIIEDSNVLLAKAGGETEKQIYRFNKGDNDLSLRFDLTVPLSKYVAKNYNDLSFPFRRYQIGKVYRGERPQKGRFREFYQCDIDIIGDGELSNLNDAELPAVIYNTFKEVGFEKFTICINNRKILNGLFSSLELKDKSTEILRIIDKLEKIGDEAVKEEFEKLLIPALKVEKILEFIKIKGDTDSVIEKLQSLGIENSTYVKGFEELKTVICGIRKFGVPDKNFKVDLTIARGLDYYTGTVYETVLDNYPQFGSVCSGGRYENLAEFYTNKKLPGVGISIGLSRLFYCLKEANIIASESSTTAKVMVIPMQEENMNYALDVAYSLRTSGINTLVNYTNKSVKSMLNYANRLKVPYVIIIGEDEEKNKKVTLKDMKLGSQNLYDVCEVVNILK